MHTFDLRTLDPLNVYKLLCGLVTPRPIALVTSQDAEGRVNAAPFSYFNVFGSEPPVLVISIGDRPDNGAPKDTAANIEATRQYVVHLVDETIAERMNQTSKNYPHGVNEMAEAGFTALASEAVRPPRIAESPVHMECELEQILRIGANRLIIGRVVLLHVREEIVDPARHHVRDGTFFPIGRMHGLGWYTKTREQFEMKRPK